MYAGYDPRKGRIKTDVNGLAIDRAFVAHFQVPAADAVALSAAGVLALTNLGAQATTISAGIVNPAVPRVLSVVGSVSGITGNVVITGKNDNGETISETIAANGATTVNGTKAFKEVISVQLPAQSHTPTAQVETIAVTHKADLAGTIVVTVTAAGMANSPKAINVVVAAEDDTNAKVATKIRAALNDSVDITSFFTVGGSSANIVLTTKAIAANDATLAIALSDAASTGVTMGSSTDTTAGVPYDKISVGWGDKLGLPYKLPYNTVLKTYFDNAEESTAPAVTVSETALELNTIDLHSALAGKVVDVYLLV